jgi:PKD repeat protein
VALGALLFAASAWPAAAKTCSQNSTQPAHGNPSSLWGALRPTEPEAIHTDRDSTDNIAGVIADYRRPSFSALDVENGFVFASYSFGLSVWDARAANAPAPTRLTFEDGGQGAWLTWLTGTQELRDLIWDVDAPEGVDTVVATAGVDPTGIAIWDAANKSDLVPKYQDVGFHARGVHAATIGGRNYAFGAIINTVVVPAVNGVHVYDMTAALALPSGCTESAAARSCAGVYKRSIGPNEIARFIDGFRRSDGSHFIGFSSGIARRGFEIWNVSDPINPGNVRQGGGRFLANDYIFGMAMWEQAGRQFLALHMLPGGRIFELTNCLAGQCSELPLVWSQNWNAGSAESYFVTYSKSGPNHYLYFGSDDKCSGGLRREWLFDATNFAATSVPIDLMPPGQISVSFDNPISGQTETGTVDYWSWYYANNPSGFNGIAPRMGKVAGNYFYRSAWQIFDVHEITAGIPPAANFTWSPAQIYPGTPVTFTDTSSGVPTSRSWSFPDGAPATSSVSPQSVTFASAGDKSVRLDVSNDQGSDFRIQSVTVLNPAAVVAAASGSPTTASICQPITWTATSVGGQPPLAISWQIKDAGNQTVHSGTGNPLVWLSTSTTPPGAYSGTVTVTGVGSASATSAPITLTALASIPASFAPTNEPPLFGLVQFHVNAGGATEWNWNFGDGSPQVWTNDPVAGPNPQHAYAQPGTYDVSVQVRNCVVAALSSSALPVQIIEVAPLNVLSFGASCGVPPCAFTVNTAVPFITSVEGNPDTFEYDWEGDGTFEASSPSAVSSHTYTAVGSYGPRLRLRRGAAVSAVKIADGFAVVAIPPPPPPPPPPPTISISGPASVAVDQAASYTAAASGCTPSSGGWNWSVGGGTATGTGDTRSIAWSSAGIKSLVVTNSGCSGATGTRSITVGGAGQGGLSANFTFVPAAPQPGQAVSFDAASSTGGATAFLWNFGDGQTATGAQASHTFAALGSYSVKLDVGKQDPACPLGLCNATVTKTVVVAGPALVASFDTSADCSAQVGLLLCAAQAGQEILFRSTSAGSLTSWAWTFGDGGTASGPEVRHTFTQGGTFQVSLTIANGSQTASDSKLFSVTAPPPPKKVAIAWIAQTQKPVLQTSDLSVNNPSDVPMTVDIFFRKRGVPEANPPKQTRTIPVRGTIFIGDVLSALFARPDQSGFIVVEVKEGVGLPIVTSFNTIFDAGGNQFGQTLSGVPLLESAAEASTARTWHVVGLNDDAERDSYFGLSNPGSAQVNMKLFFYDRSGDLLSQNDSFSVPGFGQKQFSLIELRGIYKVLDETDWRVQIEPVGGSPLLIYGANRRVASKDPSSLGAVDGTQQRVYLLGAIDGIGLKNSLWQSDLVMTNSTASLQRARVAFSEIGLQAPTSAPVFFDLAAGETKRVTDVITATFGRSNKAGLLTIDSQAAVAPHLIVQGESYNNADPAKRFGQTLPPIYESDAAAAGHSMNLVGLRQDADYRVVLWVANVAATETATMDLVYRDLAGKVVKRVDRFSLPPGRVKQFPKSEHPSVTGGRFTIGIEVLSGKVIAGAQVVNNKSNDPAYVKGQAN